MSASGSLLEQMKQQHRDIEGLLTQPIATDNLADTVSRVAAAWLPHTVIEEQILMPALQHAGANEPALAEARVRRDLVKLLMSTLQDEPTGEDAAAQFAVLSSEIDLLIGVEERPTDGVLALAETHNVDLDALKDQVDERRSQFQSNAEGESSRALEPTSLRFPTSRANRQNEEYSSMPYESNTRDRDERGRFQSDNRGRGGNGSRGNDRDRDENGRFTSDDDRGYSSRPNRDYDDDYRRSGSNGGGPGRDENGRFTSEGYSSRSSRYQDEDRRGGYDDDRGNGRGWYGDSQGHAEAAREGWDDRRGYSSQSSRDDDDRNYRSSSRGNYYDDRGRGGAGRDENGRFTSNGSSRDYDGREGSGDGRGWYGDPRGHSMASREGWENRRGESRSSRSQYDDDDRRGGAGGGRGGHGGWFGDPQGHSEASRRGWEERR